MRISTSWAIAVTETDGYRHSHEEFNSWFRGRRLMSILEQLGGEVSLELQCPSDLPIDPISSRKCTCLRKRQAKVCHETKACPLTGGR